MAKIKINSSSAIRDVKSHLEAADGILGIAERIAAADGLTDIKADIDRARRDIDEAWVTVNYMLAVKTANRLKK